MCTIMKNHTRSIGVICWILAINTSGLFEFVFPTMNKFKHVSINNTKDKDEVTREEIRYLR